MKRIVPPAVVTAVIAFCATALADAPRGPQPEAGIGLPRDVSLDGHRIDWLLTTTAFFVTVLFVIMVVWMVWAIVVHREGKHKAEYDHGDGKKHVTTAVMLSSVIFLVVDGNLFVNSMVDVSEAFWNYPTGEGVVRIEVNARQWNWGARWAGNDGRWNTADDVVTLNDVRVPVETPVLIQLRAVDVIHSFYLPNFRTKSDVVPGMTNPLWFQAQETGQFEIACAQHCGVHHYKMRGVLTVLPKDEYEDWLRRASTQAEHAFDPNDEGAAWGWDWVGEEGE